MCAVRSVYLTLDTHPSLARFGKHRKAGESGGAPSAGPAPRLTADQLRQQQEELNRIAARYRPDPAGVATEPLRHGQMSQPAQQQQRQEQQQRHGQSQQQQQPSQQQQQQHRQVRYSGLWAGIYSIYRAWLEG